MRTILVALVLGAAVFISVQWGVQWGGRSTAVLTPATDQNVLLITVDTLRADALGAYGGQAATPHLDALARQGALFRFAHAHATVTLPSHASILTGRYPFEHGVRDNSGYRLGGDTPTLATMLKAQGYATGAFVAAFPLSARFGLNQGFDVYDDERVADVTGPADFRMAERAAPDVVARATDWIRKQQGRWFAWVHLFDPHAPYQAPEPYASRYRANPYHGEVAFTDAAVGSLLDAVRGRERTTLVAMTADHGEALGDHGELTHGVFAYEATLRVPLILAQVSPGQSAATRGVVADTPARHVDLVPTVLDALALPPRAGSGRSLLPPANEHGDAANRDSYFESMSSHLNRGWAPLRGVIAAREKFIDLPLAERYALEEDPGEQQNLVARDPARLRTLEAQLKALGATLPGQRATESTEVSERLRALGYVSGSAPRKAVYGEADDPKRLIHVDRLLHEAIDHFQHRRIEEAASRYQRIIAERPDMAIAYRHLAFLAWEVGDVRSAVSVLRDALSRGVRDAALIVQLGTYLAESGRAGEAIPLLEQALTSDRPDVEAQNALGIAYAQAGRTREAVAAFEQILRREPRNASALENLGSLHLQSGNLPAARAALLQALQLNPSSSRAHTTMGVVAMRQGDRSGAFAHWRSAVQANASEFDALFNLGVELAAAGSQEEARPHLERFAATAPPALYGAELDRVRAILRQ